MTTKHGWRCDKCQYFREDTTEDVGWCHRYAPRPVVGAQPVSNEGPIGPTEVRWPLVANDDWCGEFQPALGRGPKP